MPQEYPPTNGRFLFAAYFFCLPQRFPHERSRICRRENGRTFRLDPATAGGSRRVRRSSLLGGFAAGGWAQESARFPRQREGAASPRIGDVRAANQVFELAGAVAHGQAPSEARARGNRAEGGGGTPPQLSPGLPHFLCGSPGRAAVGARGGIRQRGGSNGHQMMDTAATVRTSGATGGGPIIIGLLCDPVRGSNGRDGSSRPASSDQPETLRRQGHNVGR